MRLLITGSRNWTDSHAVLNKIVYYAMAGREDLTVVHGACPTGADAIADSVCDFLGVNVERYPADWDRYGDAAGPLRNQQMVDTKPDLVIGFVTPESRGTRDCLRRAKAAGIETIVVEASSSG